MSLPRTIPEAEVYAAHADLEDALAPLRQEFLFPKAPDGRAALYFAGNSLGLQPRNARKYIQEELEDWERFGVEGHLQARHPWLPYHEFVTEPLARVVGAKPSEVVAMNSLSVNLHLMMASFYRPTAERFKILIEAGAFPSDQYAVASQARFHGFDPAHAVVEVRPRAGEATIRADDLLGWIEREGSSIALVMLGNVNYLTGQAFDIPAVTAAAHAKGCRVGWDLAHGAGNLPLALHDSGADFAVWCSYKYLNSGPGGIAGVFVHERHHGKRDLPRFEGWWGHDKKTRFRMPGEFAPIASAEAWQLSNPPIFQLAALRASLELFDRATMPALRQKSEKLTAFLESLVRALPGEFCTLVTPSVAKERGAQLSLRIHRRAKELVAELGHLGAIADFREPDIMRLAPAPLYNSFEDVCRIAKVLHEQCRQS